MNMGLGSMEFYSDDFSHFKYYEENYNYSSDAERSSVVGNNTLFDESNLVGVLDDEIYSPIDSILMTDQTNDGRVSLAYERLATIPRPLAESFAASTHTLDLSHNCIKDLSFLTNFRKLTTLILDRNDTPLEATLPHLPQLRILWLNNCGIYDLSAWVRRLQTVCPDLKQLSLLGNPGCLSAFNGGTSDEHLDYRLYVIGALPLLEHLDDAAVTEEQRTKSRGHRSSYAVHGRPQRFMQQMFGSSRLMSFFRGGAPGDLAKATAVTAAGGAAVASDGGRRRSLSAFFGFGGSSSGSKDKDQKSASSRSSLTSMTSTEDDSSGSGGK